MKFMTAVATSALVGRALVVAPGSGNVRAANNTVCSVVRYYAELLAAYPLVPGACQGVLQSGGRRPVRFTGTVTRAGKGYVQLAVRTSLG